MSPQQLKIIEEVNIELSTEKTKNKEIHQKLKPKLNSNQLIINKKLQNSLPKR